MLILKWRKGELSQDAEETNKETNKEEGWKEIENYLVLQIENSSFFLNS